MYGLYGGADAEKSISMQVILFLKIQKSEKNVEWPRGLEFGETRWNYFSAEKMVVNI